VIRSSEHRYICTVYKRKLIVQTPHPLPPVGPAMTNGRHTTVTNIDILTDQEILISERKLQFITVFTRVVRRSL